MIIRSIGTRRPGPDDPRRFHNARLIPPKVGLFARPKPRAGTPAATATKVPTWLVPPRVSAPGPVTLVRARVSPAAPIATPPVMSRPVYRARTPPELNAQPATLLGE
jgi:hypothetical protein